MSEGIFYAYMFCVCSVCTYINMARKWLYLGLYDGSGRLAPDELNKAIVGHFYTGEVIRKDSRSSPLH